MIRKWFGLYYCAYRWFKRWFNFN